MRCSLFLVQACLLLSLLLPATAQQAPTALPHPTHSTLATRQQAAPAPKSVPRQQTAPPAHRPKPWPRLFENFPVNVAAFRLVNSHRSPVADVFFMYYYWLGNGYFLIPVAVLVLIFRRKMLGTFLLAILLEYLIVTLIKYIFAQPRPPLVLDHVHILQIPSIKIPFLYSFPSGDVSQAFATAVPFMVDAKWSTQLLLFIYAALIGYERMYVGVHFPLDVMVGALVGTLSAALALYITGKWRKATVLTAEEMAK